MLAVSDDVLLLVGVVGGVRELDGVPVGEPVTLGAEVRDLVDAAEFVAVPDAAAVPDAVAVPLACETITASWASARTSAALMVASATTPSASAS